ncbi:hypothetical protein Tco_1340173 [Tanacetum coccineum]
MEALIEDENAMEKEVADKVKELDQTRLDSDASATQQPHAHTSSAWKITDTRDAPSGSLMPSPISEEDEPTTPEPEWTILSKDYPEPENNRENVYATTYQDPEENKLQRKTGDIGSFIK